MAKVNISRTDRDGDDAVIMMDEKRCPGKGGC